MKKYLITFLLCFLLVGVFSLSASAQHISQEFTLKDEIYIPEEVGDTSFIDFYFMFYSPYYPTCEFDSIRIYFGTDENPTEVYYNGMDIDSGSYVEHNVYSNGWVALDTDIRTIQPVDPFEVYDLEAAILINSIDGYDELDHICDGSSCGTSDLYGIESVCPACGKVLVKSITPDVPDVPDLPDYPVNTYPSDFPPLTNVNYPFNEFFAFRGSGGKKYLVQLQANQSADNVAVRSYYLGNITIDKDSSIIGDEISLKGGLSIEVQSSNYNISCTLFTENNGSWSGKTIIPDSMEDNTTTFYIDDIQDPEYSTFDIYYSNGLLFFPVAPQTLLELVNSTTMAVIPEEIVGACWILVPLAVGLMASLIVLKLFRKKLLMV